jgi:hypothetical protein
MQVATFSRRRRTDKPEDISWAALAEAKVFVRDMLAEGRISAPLQVSSASQADPAASRL